MWSVFVVDDATECAASLTNVSSESEEELLQQQESSELLLANASETNSSQQDTVYSLGEEYNYVIFTLAPINVALNLVAMSIFYKEHRRRLLYYYMVLLCCVDTLFQIFFCSTIALYIVLQVNDDINLLRSTFTGILLVRFLAVAAQLTRNWTVAFIAAYRVSC